MSIERENFRETLTYTTTNSCKQIMQDLDEIAEIGKQAEEKRPLAITMFSIGLIGIIFSFIVFSTAPAIVGIIMIISVIITIIGGIFLNKYNRLNIPIHRYELLKKVLSMLERDIEGKEIKNHTIFSPPIDKTKQVISRNHPYRNNWKLELYKDPWLTLEGEFLDGTRFQLSLTEFNQIVSGWKRSSRGKSKHKRKTKQKGGEIILKFNCLKHSYGALKILQPNAQGAIKLPENVRISGLKVTEKGMVLKVKVPPEVLKTPEETYKVITLMFLSFYQILNLARMLSQKKGA